VSACLALQTLVAEGCNDLVTLGKLAALGSLRDVNLNRFVDVSYSHARPADACWLSFSNRPVKRLPGDVS
jgi:hypothetical protein